MTKTIILFDVDGVLIRAQGYREGVRAGFEYLAKQMKQTHLQHPTHHDMLAFESQSIIFEWDSFPIMIASLLNQVPQLWKNTFGETLTSIAEAGVVLNQPDFVALAGQCPPAQAEIRPAYAAWQALFPKHPLFEELLANTHSIHAPLTRLIQNFVLGSEQFFRTYGITPQIETESFLSIYDKPTLSPENRERLLDDPSLFPVMYTARPSLPPGFILETKGYSPEAEIGQQLLEFQGAPLAGYGKMQWFAQQQGRDPSDWVKPSPMHALVAVYCALLHGQPNWEEKAFEYALTTPPAELKNEPWRIVVMEDSPNSIRGVQIAAEQLKNSHAIEFIGVGIGTEPHHLEQLASVATFVAPDVNSALERLL